MKKEILKEDFYIVHRKHGKEMKWPVVSDVGDLLERNKDKNIRKFSGSYYVWMFQAENGFYDTMMGYDCDLPERAKGMCDAALKGEDLRGVKTSIDLRKGTAKMGELRFLNVFRGVSEAFYGKAEDFALELDPWITLNSISLDMILAFQQRDANDPKFEKIMKESLGPHFDPTWLLRLRYGEPSEYHRQSG